MKLTPDETNDILDILAEQVTPMRQEGDIDRYQAAKRFGYSPKQAAAILDSRPELTSLLVRNTGTGRVVRVWRVVDKPP